MESFFKKNPILFPILVILIGIFLFWQFYFLGVVSNTIDEDFTYEAEIFSVDNFYDEKNGEFSGQLPSRTTFSYFVEDVRNDVFLVKNVFDVRTLDGDPIVNIERLYGIDSETGRHMEGFGDRNRSGYLFAPRNLSQSQDFTYWHINYDAPAEMKFVGIEELEGLRTFIFETRYEGQKIDQTDVLSHLPGVPEERGVELEPYLKLWIEPVTGSLVKYQDETIAYYYDIQTGQRLYPWNHFSNSFSDQSVLQKVKEASGKKFTYFLQTKGFPVILFLAMGSVLFLMFGPKKESQNFLKKINLIYIFSGLVFIGSVAVILGWFLDVDILKSVFPGLVTMKFSTALNFLFSSLVVIFAARLVSKKSLWAEIILPASSLIIILMMGILLVSFILGIESGIENIFVEEAGIVVDTAIPGQPSSGTMISFILIAFSGVVALFDFKMRSKILMTVGLINLGLGLLAFIGYVVDEPILYFSLNGVSTAMAFHTALFFILLAVSLVLVSRINTPLLLKNNQNES